MGTTSTRPDEGKTKQGQFQPENPGFYQRTNYVPGHLKGPQKKVSQRANYIPGPTKTPEQISAIMSERAKEGDSLSKSLSLEESAGSTTTTAPTVADISARPAKKTGKSGKKSTES